MGIIVERAFFVLFFLPVQIILQTAFFTMAFHEHHLEAFITVIRGWTPESLNLGGILHVALVQVTTEIGPKST